MTATPEPLKVAKKFNAPVVRMRQYNGKLEPQSTLCSVWPSQAKPGAFKGKTLSTVKFEDFSFPKGMKVGLVPNLDVAPGDAKEFYLYFNKDHVATLEERTSENGVPMLYGVVPMLRELNENCHLVEDVKVLAFRPFKDSAAAKKGAKWTVKVSGLLREDPDAVSEDALAADPPEGITPADEETPFQGNNFRREEPVAEPTAALY